MKRHCFLVFLAVAVAVCVSTASARLGGNDDALVGGWKPIPNLKDAEVMEMAKFAVNEYNKKSSANLKLKDIVRGETQVVSGVNYKLVLAVDGGDSKKYEAVVYDKPWAKVRSLTSFKPIKG